MNLVECPAWASWGYAPTDGGVRMAGETVKCEAICLDVRPWSRTSHVVAWLTPHGRIVTLVKGAVRPKSAFLGQYDLNYTCELVYYARSRGDLHALRECAPICLRAELRGDYRALALAGHFRRLAADFAPAGPDCVAWQAALADALDRLCLRRLSSAEAVGELLRFELAVLALMGLRPELEAESGAFALRGERRMPVDPAVAAYLRDPTRPVENVRIPLDAARAIGVFYQFHLDCASDVRRTVLGMICNSKGKQEQR